LKKFTISSAVPIWGLVSSDTKSSTDLDVVQSPYLYLPGQMSSLTSLGSIGSDNMPGLEFPKEALGTIYNGNLGNSIYGTIDYSGKTSSAMYAKWQQLMANANSTSRIIDLIFTDLAANGLVGTKSWFNSSNTIVGDYPSSNSKVKRQSSPTNTFSGQQATAKVPVRVYTRRIQYNYVYGIPAYASVLIAALIGTLTLLYLITGRTSLSKTRHYLCATSAGRLMSMLVYPGESEPQTATRTWARGVGAKRIRVGNSSAWRPVAVDPLPYPGKMNGPGHAVSMYTGDGSMHGSVSNLHGYENDMAPLIGTKPGFGSTIQMTPMQSPNPYPAPQHGGFQQEPQLQQQKYGYEQHHFASQQSGGCPAGGFGR
jgi:hypothetical protein